MMGVGPDIIEPDVIQAAGYVAAAWRQGIEAILETGRRLIEIRERFRNEPGKVVTADRQHSWRGQSLTTVWTTHVQIGSIKSLKTSS